MNITNSETNDVAYNYNNIAEIVELNISPYITDTFIKNNIFDLKYVKTGFLCPEIFNIENIELICNKVDTNKTTKCKMEANK